MSLIAPAGSAAALIAVVAAEAVDDEQLSSAPSAPVMLTCAGRPDDA